MGRGRNGEVMKLSILMLLGWIGWIVVAALAVQRHRDRACVKLWAQGAYDVGYDDRAWADTGHAAKLNKDFAVQAVMAAYDDAWKDGCNP
jgi:hypothetical protein